MANGKWLTANERMQGAELPRLKSRPHTSRYAICMVMLALFCAVTGCRNCPEENPPAELVIRATLDGKKHACAVLVYNRRRKLINEVSTDRSGLVFIKNLMPGTYALQFKNDLGQLYLAERNVELEFNDMKTLDVELGDKEGPTAASW